MESKTKEKELAVKLRKQGKTYTEILEQVKVSKSTLSLWLRNVGLAKQQKQRLTKKRYEAQLKGSEAMRQKRIKSTQEIRTKAEAEVGEVTDRELWLIGTALYWAEGAKEKKYGRRSSSVDFGNTDLHMIRLYLTWLQRSCSVDVSRMRLTLYIHESSRYRIKEVIKYWEDGIKDVAEGKIVYVYYKKHLSKTNRLRNDAQKGYYGTLRIVVSTSTNLNRRIQGWTKGICKL